MLEFRYDTQLLIEGKNLDEDAINEYFTNNKLSKGCNNEKVYTTYLDNHSFNSFWYEFC